MADLKIPAVSFPFSLPPIGGAGKNGKAGQPENPVSGSFGKKRESRKIFQELRVAFIAAAAIPMRVGARHGL